MTHEDFMTAEDFELDKVMIGKNRESILEYLEEAPNQYYLHDDEYEELYMHFLWQMFPSSMEEATNLLSPDLRIYYGGYITDNNIKKDLLSHKIYLEGEPPDLDLILKIKEDGQIHNPIVIDTGGIPLEGRHRLAAGLKYNIPVPYLYADT